MKKSIIMGTLLLASFFLSHAQKFSAMTVADSLYANAYFPLIQGTPFVNYRCTVNTIADALRGSKPINILTIDTVIHGIILSVDSFNIIGDTSDVGTIFEFSDTIFLPASPQDNDVIEGKIIMTMMVAINVKSLGTENVALSLFYSPNAGQLIKWTYDAATNTWY